MKSVSLGILLALGCTYGIRAQNFLKANGKVLTRGQTTDTVYLRGINFNNFWLDDGGPNWIYNDPNDQGVPQPYAFGDSLWFNDAKTMGCNVVRVTMTYRLFEANGNPYNYFQSGWNFIDQYIAWAKQYGMYLILDMHVPQGGLQNDTSSSPNLWQNTQNQDRLTALWHEIALRYAGDTIIAGYDLLNEPTPLNVLSAWSNLAQRIADTIRTVDNNHLIVLEYSFGITDNTGQWLPFWDLNQQQFLINDNNTMYDFHYYAPLPYALQCYGDMNCNSSCIQSGAAYGDSTIQMGTQDNTQMPLDRRFIEYDLPTWLAFRDTNNVPVNIGEWAPWYANYTCNNNALHGYEYICDLLDLFEIYGLNWQYYCYNEFRPQANGGNQGLNDRLYNYFHYGWHCDSTITTKTETIKTGAKFSVYPNPAVTSLTLQSGSGVSLFILYDITGRQVARYHLSEHKRQIDVSSLNSGMYLWKAESESETGTGVVVIR